MRVSLLWLQDYIDLSDLSPETIAATLTQLGLEVEGIERVEPLRGPVLIGKILKTAQHPNADKLRLCEVDVGGATPLGIVCGAPNAREGIKVVVACVGSTLPGDFKIKDSKIRGESSSGMLCSQKELGISEANEGIMELPESAPIGSSVSDYFQLNDCLIEVSVTPNRSDCLGMIGLARDLAARLGRPLKIPAASLEGVREDLSSAQKLSVRLSSPEDARRFVGLYMQGVRALPSPTWLQRRLQQAGMRPINLIVDATNYAMLEAGQPIHAYDERDVRGGRLEVRRARAGEKLVTLDGTERQLESSDLVIADAEKAVGLAGVMGGAQSEIKADSENILIEVAHFNPSLIRKTARRFGLHTEASHRFERGVDVGNLPWVARRVADLIYKGAAELRANGVELPLPSIAGDLVDMYPEPEAPREVSLRLSRLRQFMALPELEPQRAKSLLEGLGLGLKAGSSDTVMVWKIPSWRHDLEHETDLIEEVARAHGYDKIPTKLPAMRLGALPEHPLIEFTDQSKITLATLGLSEVISFPFMGESDLMALGLEAGHPLRATLSLANPLVEQQKDLRTTLAVSLLHALQENRRHGIQGARIFEAGRTFHEAKTLPPAAQLPKVWAHLASQGQHISARAQKDDRAIERNRIGGALDQPFTLKSWHQPETAASFFEGKAVVLRYLAAFGVAPESLSFVPVVASELPWLHPGAAASIWSAQGHCLGYVGELHPRTMKAFDLEGKGAPVLFELELESVWQATQVQRSFASSSIKFPPVTRDLALVVPTTVHHADFAASFQNFKRKKYLRDYRLFDVYQGSHIPAGKKSMAFSLHFQAEDRTLTDQDVEKEVEALLSWLKSDLAADLR